MDVLQQTKSLLKKLITDDNSAFYYTDKIKKTLLNKARKSPYEKNKFFHKYYNKLENNNPIYDNETSIIPFYTPFVEQKSDIDRSSALYTAPPEFVQQMLPIFVSFLSLPLIQSIV